MTFLGWVYVSNMGWWYDYTKLHKFYCQCLVPLTLGVCIIYYPLIRVLKNRLPHMKLNYFIPGWNLLLSAFSTYGFLTMAPRVLRLHLQGEALEIFLSRTAFESDRPLSTACFLFVTSKLPEMVDTLILLIRGKPVIFLHWYHHLTVTLFSMLILIDIQTIGLYFGTMNYGVHAFMYAYYAAMALKAVPPGFPVWIITALQIIQMIAGVIVILASGWIKFIHPECNLTWRCINLGGLIYGSYLYLFLEYAIKRYLKKHN